MYRALMEIGDYKKGEIVPDEKAEVWLQMYSVPPVEKIESKEEAKPKVSVVSKKSSVEMMDDYLNRKSDVVIKNLSKDFFNLEELDKMLKMEKADKDRSDVKRAIKNKMKEVE